MEAYDGMLSRSPLLASPHLDPSLTLFCLKTFYTIRPLSQSFLHLTPVLILILLLLLLLLLPQPPRLFLSLHFYFFYIRYVISLFYHFIPLITLPCTPPLSSLLSPLSSPLSPLSSPLPSPLSPLPSSPLPFSFSSPQYYYCYFLIIRFRL